MTDNVNFFAPPREVRPTELRLRTLRRRFRESHIRSREPFTAAQLAALGVAVFLTVLSIGVLGWPMS